MTVLLSTSANDQLTGYRLSFLQLTLTDANGYTETVLPTQTTTSNNPFGPYAPEFMHLNANTGTLVSVDVPRDTYISATLTVGAAQMTCTSVNSQDNTLTTSVFAYGATPQSQVTVTLPEPITVAGSTLNLMMQLDMSKSYTLDDCAGGNVTDAYAITPTFNLTTTQLSSMPTSYLNGKETDIEGEVTGQATGGFTMATGSAQGLSISLPTRLVNVTQSTVFQGITGSSSLTAGTFVDIDATANLDGSLLATRVAVADPNAVDTASGAILQTPTSVPVFLMAAISPQGPDPISDPTTYDYSKATYAISGSLSNLSTLPFTPSFTSMNIVPGQNVYVTAPAPTVVDTPGSYVLANTVTLIPQVLDGVVSNVATSGGFNVYTITLAPYDLFVNMAGQMGGRDLVAQPNQVVVYADSSTSLAGVTAVQAGQPYLFHGLVFNDGGVLRMDCDQIATGAAQ